MSVAVERPSGPVLDKNTVSFIRKCSDFVTTSTGKSFMLVAIQAEFYHFQNTVLWGNAEKYGHF